MVHLKTLGGNSNMQEGNLKPSNNLFTCYICTYTTRFKSWFEKHQRTHTGERPFLCTVCCKRFNTKGNLNVHLKTHIPKYECYICKELFHEKTDLTRHYALHKGHVNIAPMLKN